MSEKPTKIEATETVEKPEVVDNAKPSVRDSIRSAIRESSEAQEAVEASEKKPAKREDKDIAAKPEKEPKKVEGLKDLKISSEDDEKEVKEEKKAVVKADDSEEVEEKEVKAKTPDVKEKAPTSLPKNVSEKWAELPSDIRSYISKANKDLTDTKAELGRTVAKYRDMDAVISQYEPGLRQINATPAQAIGRLFQWMDALAGPHKNTAILQLAQNFGIDLGRVQSNNSQQTQQGQETDSQEIQQQIHPEIVEAFSALTNEVKSLKSQQEQVRQKNAEGTVNTWAGLQADGTFKNKPHFNEVRQLMFGLIQSGAVPLLEGDVIDLDGAYDAACYAHPGVRAQLETEKAEADAENRRKTEAARVAKAKSAAVGLKPSAPAAPFSASNNSQKPNGKVPSVRDSIRAALREATANN